jgi:hypothetical protein
MERRRHPLLQDFSGVRLARHAERIACPAGIFDWSRIFEGSIREPGLVAGSGTSINCGLNRVLSFCDGLLPASQAEHALDKSIHKWAES